MLSSRVVSCAAVVAVVFAACGGKTADLDGGTTQAPPGTDAAPEASPSPPTPIDAGGRTCPPECLVGHQCCTGGTCGGIPAAMPSSCCSCLPGEIDSMQCPNGKCGG